ncbi:TPA: hypothetical protein ACHVAK_002403, partial [Streptococcus suis]
VAIVEEARYYYVQRQNSIMNSALSRKKMSDTLEFLDNRIAFYQCELEQLARIHYCHALIRILGSASKMMASQEIQSLQKKYILNFKEVDWKSMNIGVKHYGIYFLASKNLYIISKVYQIFKKS